MTLRHGEFRSLDWKDGGSKWYDGKSSMGQGALISRQQKEKRLLHTQQFVLEKTTTNDCATNREDRYQFQRLVIHCSYTIFGARTSFQVFNPW